MNAHCEDSTKKWRHAGSRRPSCQFTKGFSLWRTSLHFYLLFFFFLFYENEPRGSCPRPWLPCITLIVSSWPPIPDKHYCSKGDRQDELPREGKPHFRVLRMNCRVRVLWQESVCYSAATCSSVCFRQKILNIVEVFTLGLCAVSGAGVCVCVLCMSALVFFLSPFSECQWPRNELSCVGLLSLRQAKHRSGIFRAPPLT